MAPNPTPPESPNAGRDPNHGRTGMPPWMIAGLILTLLGGGAWIVYSMDQTSKDEDCLMSGRKNCNVMPEYGR